MEGSIIYGIDIRFGKPRFLPPDSRQNMDPEQLVDRGPFDKLVKFPL